MIQRIAGVTAVALLAVGVGCSPAPESADLLLLNGRLVTVDPQRPEARALAARDGLIVAVGSDAEVERFRGPDTEVIDLGGRLAVPGFIEGHAHFTGIGRALMNVDLRGAQDFDELVAGFVQLNLARLLVKLVMAFLSDDAFLFLDMQLEARNQFVDFTVESRAVFGLAGDD